MPLPTHCHAINPSPIVRRPRRDMERGRLLPGGCARLRLRTPQTGGCAAQRQHGDDLPREYRHDAQVHPPSGTRRLTRTPKIGCRPRFQTGTTTVTPAALWRTLIGPVTTFRIGRISSSACAARNCSRVSRACWRSCISSQAAAIAAAAPASTPAMLPQPCIQSVTFGGSAPAGGEYVIDTTRARNTNAARPHRTQPARIHGNQRSRS